MTAQSDGYRLNAALRSPDPVPSTAMHDVLASLEQEMRRATKGQPVVLTEWVQWARKSKMHANALIRVFFLIVATNGMSADDIHTLMVQFRDTLDRRHRPPQLIRETSPRRSPQLW